MKKTLHYVAFACLIVYCIAAMTSLASATDCSSYKLTAVQEGEITYIDDTQGEITRTFLYYVPPGVDPEGAAVPLVFVFHGGNGDADYVLAHKNMSDFVGKLVLVEPHRIRVRY